MENKYQQDIHFFGNEPMPLRDGRVRRRQFSSCDQCRKGKRGCNVFERQEDLWSISGPCSMCSKTGKECTFEWIKSRGEISQGKEGRPAIDATSDKTQYQTLNCNQVDWTLPDQCLGESEYALGSSIPTQIYPEQKFSTNLLNLLEDESIIASPEYNSPRSTINSSDLQTLEGLANIERINNVVSFASFNPFDPTTSINSLGGSETTIDESSRRPKKKIRRTFMPTSSDKIGASGLSRSSSRRELISGARRFSTFPLAPSSANLEYRLAISTNKSAISGSLLRIYHDSMENALSCWLIERTCPYDIEVQPYLQNLPSERIHSTNEWGSIWSNRIYERVCSLDKASSALRGKDLTLSEERLVEVALRKAVMAFATQWAYSSSEYTLSLTPSSRTLSQEATHCRRNDLLKFMV